jgi:hypothetical protein
MLEVVPGQRGSSGFAEQEIADPAPFKSGQGEKTMNNKRQAWAILRVYQTKFRESASG